MLVYILRLGDIFECTRHECTVTVVKRTSLFLSCYNTTTKIDLCIDVFLMKTYPFTFNIGIVGIVYGIMGVVHENNGLIF